MPFKVRAKSACLRVVGLLECSSLPMIVAGIGPAPFMPMRRALARRAPGCLIAPAIHFLATETPHDLATDVIALKVAHYATNTVVADQVHAELYVAKLQPEQEFFAQRRLVDFRRHEIAIEGVSDRLKLRLFMRRAGFAPFAVTLLPFIRPIL